MSGLQPYAAGGAHLCLPLWHTWWQSVFWQTSGSPLYTAALPATDLRVFCLAATGGCCPDSGSLPIDSNPQQIKNLPLVGCYIGDGRGLMDVLLARFAFCQLCLPFVTSEWLGSLLQAITSMLTSLKSAQAGCKLLAEALCWLFSSLLMAQHSQYVRHKAVEPLDTLQRLQFRWSCVKPESGRKGKFRKTCC